MLAPLCEICGLDTTPSYFLEYIVPVWLDVQPLARLSACKISLIEWLLGRQGRLATCSHTTRARPGRNEEINPFCATGSRGRNKLIAWCDVSLSLHSRQHQNRQPTKASCLCSAGPTGGWLTWYEPDSPHYGNMCFAECLRHACQVPEACRVPEALDKPHVSVVW